MPNDVMFNFNGPLARGVLDPSRGEGARVARTDRDASTGEALSETSTKEAPLAKRRSTPAVPFIDAVGVRERGVNWRTKVTLLSPTLTESTTTLPSDV